MANGVTSGGEVVINSAIDQLLENLPLGSLAKAIGNNLYGINFRQTGNVVPKSKDTYGFTFFTRPQLNMSSLNITNYRGFYNLMTSNKISYQMFTRLILDPRLGYARTHSCPFVDDINPFMSVLTNNIRSVSGWPDLSVPTHTSETGLYGEEHSYVDGVTNHLECFDLDFTFNNSKGNPLIYLFYIWIKYESLVFEGILNPYQDMITEHEIDYNTRIYRVVLDQQKRYVTYIASTGASFPINVPTGNLFDYNIETPYNTKNSEISIRFRCNGFTAFEDILKLEFNKTVAIFNPEMKKVLNFDMGTSSDASKSREDGSVPYRVSGCQYVKLPHNLALSMDAAIGSSSYFTVNHKAYPYINLITNELEWWVNGAMFSQAAQSSFNSRLEKTGIDLNGVANKVGSVSSSVSKIAGNVSSAKAAIGSNIEEGD